MALLAFTGMATAGLPSSEVMYRTPEHCSCTAAMGDLTSPYSTWMAMSIAASSLPDDCSRTYLRQGMAEPLLDKLRYDWDGFCELLAKGRSVHLDFLVMDAIDESAGRERVCAIDRLLRECCPEGNRLACRFMAQKPASVLKRFDPPEPCSSLQDHEQRHVQTFDLEGGASVTLTTAAFEGTRHTLRRTTVGEDSLDALDGIPIYGSAGVWPKRKVLAATLKLSGGEETSLDVTGMYDPEPLGGAFQIERNGSGPSFLLKGRLGAGANVYRAEWMVHGNRSLRTSIRLERQVRTELSYPENARLQADLPSEFATCSVVRATSWWDDSAGLDMVVTLACRLSEQVVLRYLREGTGWKLHPRSDPFAPAPSPDSSTASTVPDAPPTRLASPAYPVVSPGDVRQIDPQPVPAREHYPSAAEQRELIGPGSPPPTAERPAAGTTINRSNLSKFTEKLGPSLSWMVRKGTSLRIGEYRQVSLPHAFLAATQKYSGSVTMGPGGAPTAYVAGLPFAQVRAEDAGAAAKLMWNHEAATAVDDLDIEPVRCDTGLLSKSAAPLQVERHFHIYHFLRLFFTGRLEVAPKPAIEPNELKVRYRETVYPLIEPFDLKGSGATMMRYLDPSRMDDTWLYFPQLRRVRRLSVAQRSDALFNQDIDADSYGGFAGNTPWFEWRMLGELTTLALLHEQKSDDNLGYMPAESVWEPRRVWVLEGRPKVDGYVYSKRVVYLDKESYRIVRAEMYDLRGEPWKSCINGFHFPDPAPREGATSIAREAGTQPSMTMVDIQIGHATVCDLGARDLESGGWFLNAGEERGGNAGRYEPTFHMGGR